MSPKCENGSSVVHRVSFRVCETGFVINLPIVLSSGPSKKVPSNFLFLSSLFPLFFFLLLFGLSWNWEEVEGDMRKIIINNIYNKFKKKKEKQKETTTSPSFALGDDQKKNVLGKMGCLCTKLLLEINSIVGS